MVLDEVAPAEAETVVRVAQLVVPNHPPLYLAPVLEQVLSGSLHGLLARHGSLHGLLARHGRRLNLAINLPDQFGRVWL